MNYKKILILFLFLITTIHLNAGVMRRENRAQNASLLILQLSEDYRGHAANRTLFLKTAFYFYLAPETVIKYPALLKWLSESLSPSSRALLSLLHGDEHELESLNPAVKAAQIAFASGLKLGLLSLTAKKTFNAALHGKTFLFFTPIDSNSNELNKVLSVLNYLLLVVAAEGASYVPQTEARIALTVCEAAFTAALEILRGEPVLYESFFLNMLITRALFLHYYNNHVAVDVCEQFNRLETELPANIIARANDITKTSLAR